MDPSSIPPFSVGQLIDTPTLNAIIEGVARRIGGPGVTHTPHGTWIAGGGQRSPQEPPTMAVVTGFTGSNRAFLCQKLDANGEATDDPFTVYARSRVAAHHRLGEGNLLNSSPNYVVGSLIQIQMQVNFISLPPGTEGSWVSDWFAIDTLTEFCEA